MKQILSSLQDVTLSRIRNPILGAFVFSWSALNIKGLALFLLNPVPEKITQIKSWQVNYTDDLFIPLGLSVIYLVILPLIQIAHQYLDEGLFQPIKYKIKHQSLRNYYKGMREVNEYKAESDEQRIAALKEANLLTWPDEKKRMIASVLNNKEELSNKVSELKEIEVRVEPALNRARHTSEAYKHYVSKLSLIKNTLSHSSINAPHKRNQLNESLEMIIKDLLAINKGDYEKASHLFTHYITANPELSEDFEAHLNSYLLNQSKLENSTREKIELRS
ncbi:hypothetical protein EDB69_1345 [Vibrio crassostreae]|uniref:hypothetical protein n=1 Tax=Vibrio crassostreae TaxID=246167 RepID=UPI000F49A0A9|nr:hypothetical protein [Vibrio crassostreae]ROO75374.1 hypothetical protein EDB64_0349 [Vibrio crassostreae]ROP13381.1 hypothetical protein EDB63_0373 [Vibrio crassostreae]ROQ87456.1 hypothetical protein EDB72_1002 [Vibrio crassostreae]ROR88173.1 hypothetical protein EDB66_1115 [Vibrio crassostreae]RPE95380.1 hypothetical protein EDB68_1421 [Vibrio crassostreae]